MRSSTGPQQDPTAVALLAALCAQLAHALGILADLGADSLTRRVLPTAWSAAGPVQHLAVDATRSSTEPLDAAPLRWPADMFGDFRLPDLRAARLHVMTETACHAGHLDAARELIDGRTWLILD